MKPKHVPAIKVKVFSFFSRSLEHPIGLKKSLEDRFFSLIITFGAGNVGPWDISWVSGTAIETSQPGETNKISFVGISL